jgi:hypothetical protein
MELLVSKEKIDEKDEEESVEKSEGKGREEEKSEESQSKRCSVEKTNLFARTAFRGSSSPPFSVCGTSAFIGIRRLSSMVRRSYFFAGLKR